MSCQTRKSSLSMGEKREAADAGRTSAAHSFLASLDSFFLGLRPACIFGVQRSPCNIIVHS